MEQLEEWNKARRDFDFAVAHNPAEYANPMERLKVPNAPFKGTYAWTQLGLKRALTEAVDGGYDRISWATVKMNADMNSLRHAADKLEYALAPGESYGTLTAWRKGEEIFDDSIRPAELEGAVGKEVAQRLLAKKPASAIEYEKPGLVASNPESPELWGRQRKVNRHLLEGDDIKEATELGGRGMAYYYDQVLPQNIKKLLGKKVYGFGKENPINLEKISLIRRTQKGIQETGPNYPREEISRMHYEDARKVADHVAEGKDKALGLEEGTVRDALERVIEISEGRAPVFVGYIEDLEFETGGGGFDGHRQSP